MPTDRNEQVLKKVRQLYALAESTTSEHEAATAAAAAERLLQEHRLTEADARAGAAQPDEVVHRDPKPLFTFAGMLGLQAWMGNLATELGDAYGCVTFGNPPDWEVIGRPSDIALLREQFAAVCAQVNRIHSATFAPTPFGGSTRGFGESRTQAQKAGIVETILRRMREEMRRARSDATASAGLVKLDTRLQDALAFARSLGLNFGTTTVAHDSVSHYAGQRAGQNAPAGPVPLPGMPKRLGS